MHQVRATMQLKVGLETQEGTTSKLNIHGHKVVSSLELITMLDPDKLNRLLHEWGIGSEFIDFSGATVHTPLENRLQIFQCMGFNIANQSDVDRLLMEKELSIQGRWLDPVVVAAEGKVTSVVVRVSSSLLKTRFGWKLLLEDGNTRQGEFVPQGLPELDRHQVQDIIYHSREFVLASLPVGYHQLQLEAINEQVAAEIIVAPINTWQPVALANGRRMWGMSTQLYTVRSAGNWGMGDFSDLIELCGLAAKQGADFILLNPLHCPDLRYPENASPYSPDDRRFLNPLYLHLPWSEDFDAPSVHELLDSTEFQSAMRSARAENNVDYATVCKLKMQVLELMYRAFTDRNITDLQHLQFQYFVNRDDAQLAAFAQFQAQRSSVSGSVQSDPAFHCYLQWLAQKQLQKCQEYALAQGMRIGLVQDLAVGSIDNGSEVQTNLPLFCLKARIGAPPDYFNPQGQNWGLPPLSPQGLINTGCRHIRTLLQANMRGCGALRIDHVMSLMRLWWCPDDGSNANGAYVYYPVDVLFAILKLESQRQHCAVIGEDLGVVPPEIRSYLDTAQVFSNSVFYFEKYDGWHFRKPEHYKPHALAMMANHDVPPLASWWSEDDLAIRLRIGLIADTARFNDELNWRRGEKGQILVWLEEQGLLPDSWSTSDNSRALDDELKVAVTRACGRIASSLVSIQLDDLAGADLPINIPGTNEQYANWRRKLPLETTAIFSSTIAVRMMLAMCEGRST